jgi:radical SAM protein with 4Fe4S-binding SPASM domain
VSCTTWNSPIIHCTGEVLLCCHDIFNTVKIGNVLERRFEDIWNDPEYQKIRSLARERRLPVCQQCGK